MVDNLLFLQIPDATIFENMHERKPNISLINYPCKGFSFFQCTYCGIIIDNLVRVRVYARLDLINKQSTIKP